jgi:Mrp family chromosome partitioning ATPase/capsular polysaccharide biosynthesis protein
VRDTAASVARRSSALKERGHRVDPRAALPIAVTAFIIAATAAYLVSSRQPGTFEARASLSEDATLSRLGPDPQAARTTQQRLTVYARVAESLPVLSAVSDRFDTPVTALERMIDAAVSEDGDLLTVKGRGRDPALTAAVVNAVAQGVADAAARDSGAGSAMGDEVSKELSARVQRQQRLEATVERLAALEDPRPYQQRRLRRLTRLLALTPASTALLVPLADARTASPLSVVDPAITPTEPVEPRPALDGLLAGLLGMLVVLPLVYVPHFLDGVVSDPGDVREETGLPTLAVIPRVPGDWHRPRAWRLATLLAPTSRTADAYRALRVGLDLSSPGTHGRTVLVAGPGRSDGKNAVAANLAIALAQTGRRIVLVDADIDRPRLHTFFGVPNRRGLADVLDSPALHFATALIPTAEPGLRLLPAGDARAHRYAHVENAAMRRFDARLKAEADIIVINGPPLRDSGVSEILGPMADVVVLALDAGRSRRDDVRNAVKALTRAGAHVLGVALLRLPPRWTAVVPMRTAGRITRRGRGTTVPSTPAWDTHGGRAPQPRSGSPLPATSNPAASRPDGNGSPTTTDGASLQRPIAAAGAPASPNPQRRGQDPRQKET